MQYQFPEIFNIQQVLPHLNDDFVVANKGTFTVINYVVMTSDTFRPINADDPAGSLTSMIRRECRGIIFDNDGKVIRRPYHKFFNVNEREETIGLNLDAPHVILEKLDGSMIAPFVDSAGKLRWGTKMVAEEFEKVVVNFVDLHPQYQQLALDLIQFGTTPIFEWMSTDNRIVIDYGEQALVLTGARQLNTGEYKTFDVLQAVASKYGVPVVGAYNGGAHSMEKLVSEATSLIGEEGYVIRYSDGHMAKVKSDWYLAIHKAKEKILYERYVADMIINNQIDDVLPHLPESDRKAIESYQDQLVEHIVHQVRSVSDLSYELVVHQGVDRKTFALNFAPIFGPFASIIFRHFDSLSGGIYAKDYWHDLVFEETQSMWLKNCATNSKFEAFKKATGCGATMKTNSLAD